MKNIFRLLTLTVLCGGDLSAQTLKWTYSFPIPTNSQVELLARMPQSEAYRFSAVDGWGGSVWLARLISLETGEELIRLVWLNSNGKPLGTNDIVGEKRLIGDTFYQDVVNVRIVRFTTTEVALQVDTYGIFNSGKFMRRIKRSKFVQKDVPLPLEEDIPSETRASTDKLGFFSYKKSRYDGTNALFIIRRYSN